MSTFGPHPIFGSFPHIGFIVGESEEEQAFFVFERDQPKPIDWGGGRDVTSKRIPGGPRTLYTDMGALPLRLETGVMFRDAAMFQRFWRIHNQVGTLRMNADWTAWPGQSPSPVRIAGRDYVEFANVVIAEPPGAPVPDSRGVMHCTVVFEREDGTQWS